MACVKRARMTVGDLVDYLSSLDKDLYVYDEVYDEEQASLRLIPVCRATLESGLRRQYVKLLHNTIEWDSGDKPNIEFVSYDGEYPNLCSGVVKLRIDGVERSLPRYCLCSGGNVWFDDDYCSHVESGPWSISPGSLPEDLKPLVEEITRIVNENIPHGCCGGCI